ncbi:MAG: anthranilate phosphoribosyltransferase, partial [Verrucomicrobiota bacterium]|nr:anthranilate phosphoribosyltransferase [Verrucomicrobiota bacterium]
PRRDAVLLNAAHALFVAAKTDSALEGWELAASVIDDGLAKRKLEELTQS